VAIDGPLQDILEDDILLVGGEEVFRSIVEWSDLVRILVEWAFSRCWDGL
jgi:hypothetical protein